LASTAGLSGGRRVVVRHAVTTTNLLETGDYAAVSTRGADGSPGCPSNGQITKDDGGGHAGQMFKIPTLI
jgi:hypothetical protein